MGVPKASKIPKTCYIYAIVMKFAEFIPRVKKIQKYVNNFTHPLGSADNSISLQEISVTSRKTVKLHFDNFFVDSLCLGLSRLL